MAKELYVGHISESATEEDLVRLFSVMGTVTSVHLIVDPVTKEFKRCGYVRMSSSVDPNEVVETLDGALLLDQQITVSIARPKKPGMSKGGPGRYAGGPKRGFGETTGAASRAGAGPKKYAEAKGKAERKPAEGPKPGRFSSGGKVDEAKQGTGPKPARPGKSFGGPSRDSGRKK